MTETDSIELKGIHYKKSSLFPLVNFTYRRELFDDSNSKLTRSIKASWLDSHIDTESDFDVLLGPSEQEELYPHPCIANNG